MTKTRPHLELFRVRVWRSQFFNNSCEDWESKFETTQWSPRTGQFSLDLLKNRRSESWHDNMVIKTVLYSTHLQNSQTARQNPAE